MFRERILPLIGWIVLSIWSRTVRLRFENEAVMERIAAEGKNCIYAFWHGRAFLLPHTYRKTGFMIPASESRDGEILAVMLKRFGFEIVRGSSKRKGDRALLGLVEGLRKGKSIAVTVDGPRGPAFEVKQGVAYLAGKLQKPIVPVAISAKRYWLLEKTWDKHMLPVPFTQGVIVFGDPIIVEGLSERELETKRGELEAALNRLTNRADEYFRNKTQEASRPGNL